MGLELSGFCIIIGYVYVCMYVSMGECIYAGRDGWMDVSMSTCMYMVSVAELWYLPFNGVLRYTELSVGHCFR